MRHPLRLPFTLAVTLGALGCRASFPGARPVVPTTSEADARRDSLELADMIVVRERAMIAKDLATIARQFADDVTWLNAGGVFLEGKPTVTEFHRELLQDDSVGYRYEAGKTRVRLTDADNAIVYYPWKMFWYRRATPGDTVNREIGIMTLSAQRRAGAWRWIAVTNQHTRVFRDSIAPPP